MDELEFRRQAVVDPHDTREEFADMANASPANRKWLEEMKQFDRQLGKAMEVEVPAGLAERLLLRQAMLADPIPDAPVVTLPRRKTSGWKPLAIAASVAFLVGVSTRWLPWPLPQTSEASLAQVALAHVYGEEPFIQGVDEQVSLQTINAKMEKYGATLMNMQGMARITYVNHCAFYQGPALHMVLQGKMGPVTLFLVPKHVPLQLEHNFDDGQLKGEIIKLKGANLVLIGEMGESLEPISQQIESRLHWSI
jgi:hypothetical protein